MIKSRVRRWSVASTFGAIAVVSSLVVSVGGNALASASQKPDESTTTTTVAPTTTTTAAPTITTTPATVSAVLHDNTWAQLTAQKQKLARSFLSDFRAIRFATRDIPPGSPISYDASNGEVAVQVSGYYQVSFSVYAERTTETNYSEQVTDWGLGVYKPNLDSTPISQCTAASNWFPFTTKSQDHELFSYVTSRTCIVQLESKYKYALLKFTTSPMNLEIPSNQGGAGMNFGFGAPASLTMNLLDASQ